MCHAIQGIMNELFAFACVLYLILNNISINKKSLIDISCTNNVGTDRQNT